MDHTTNFVATSKAAEPDAECDTLTILTHAALNLAKTWKADGTIGDYADGKFFAPQQARVTDLAELSALLTKLQTRRHSCLIRGRYVGDELAAQRDAEFRKGRVRRALDYFDDQPLHAVCLDIDDYVPMAADAVTDAAGAVQEFILVCLPDAFHKAGYHWQLSNSAGHPSKGQQLRAHVWFWLAQPLTSAQLKAWAVAVGLSVDLALFNPVQIHYTSAPVMEPGLVDPVPVRSGFVPGDSVLIRPAEVPATAAAPAGGRGQRLKDLAAADSIAQALADAGMVKSQGRDGSLNIECPFEDQHSTPSGDTSTVYYLPNTGGFAQSHFKCLHASCQGRGRADFLSRLGIDEVANEFDALDLAPASVGQAIRDRVDRTDAGNVALLADLTAGDLRYVPERRTWLAWGGERWTPDAYGTVAQDAAMRVGEHYLEKAAKLREQAKDDALDARERKRVLQAAEHLEKWAALCRGRRGIEAMLALARADDRFTLPAAELDRDPWLFGCANGVVDLRTGALRAAGREDYVTRHAPVAYRLSSKAPRWLQFIEEVTARHASAGGHTVRPALASYLQRALGYSMTGSTREQKMFIAIGEGSNGKSVMLDMLQWLLDGYCQSVPPEALMAARHDPDAERASPTMASLAGTRMAVSSESRDRHNLDVALVKRHTGGGFLTARFMRENSFRFEITHKLWLMTNHKPGLDHMDEALRGRLHLIPFDMRWNRPGHAERNPALPDGDKDLLQKLKAEAEGVLAWLVAGAVAYHRDGLEPPDEVSGMTRSFFKDQDPVGRWIDCCQPCEPRHGMTAAKLFDHFQRWIADSWDSRGDQPESQHAFSRALKARGIECHKTKDGMHYGLRVTDDGL